MSPPVGNELECPSCGTVAIDRDFCSCGEYLAWNLAIPPAATRVPEPATAPTPEPAAYRSPVPAVHAPTLLTLRDPARPDDPGGAAVSVSVMPGTDATVMATVRNQGEIVDSFDVRVDGLPDGWWSVSSETVFLNPWGSSGDYEQEVQVRLHPPTASESEARAWPLTVIARSRSLGEDVASAQATLTILPFQNTVMEVAPERRRGRRHANFDVVVENHGNSPMEIVVSAQDPAARCPITVTPERTTVPIGESAAAVVRVGVPHPLFFARPVLHHLTVTHRASGMETVPVPQRVSFQQRPWLAWWMPPTFALIAALVTLVMIFKPKEQAPVAPRMVGRTLFSAKALIRMHHLKLDDVTYEVAPEGFDPGDVIRQHPIAGGEIIHPEVELVVAKAPEPTVMGVVPRVKGRTLGQASSALTKAQFTNSAQPPSAGDDWVVVRQDPAPGSKHELGTPITLAVEARRPAAKPKPKPTVGPKRPVPAKRAQAAKKATVAAKPPAPPKPAQAAKPEPKPNAARRPALPADFVFAGASNGQLYRWASRDPKAARLTSPKYRLETATKADDGYVAVQVGHDGRRLVSISADGKTVEPIAEGSFYRPAYSSDRGLLAVISSRGRRGPADAGKLCVMDLLGKVPLACAPAGDRRVGRPSWAPDGRAVLVVAAGADGGHDELLSFAATGGDAKRWGAPTSVYRWADIRSAVWLGNDRLAVLLADGPGAPGHLRLLARSANGSFRPVKDFPALTGYELAGTGHYLALRRGNDATGDGAMVLLDVDRTRPLIRSLSSGVNPAWAK